MLLYCNDRNVVATHADNPILPASLYGNDIRIIQVPDGVKLDRVGPPPRNPANDLRPYAIPAPTPEMLSRYSAFKRWLTSSNGVDVNGMPIATDATSRQELVHLKHAFDTGILTSASYKTADGGFIVVNSATLNVLYEAVTQHVQACFNVERTISSDISSGKIATWSDVDQQYARLLS